MKPSELLADPSKWTQGVMARDAQGNEVSPQDENAICFCLLGALEKCNYEHKQHLLYRVLRVEYDEYSIVSFNDSPRRTHEEVLNLLREVGL